MITEQLDFFDDLIPSTFSPFPQGEKVELSVHMHIDKLYDEIVQLKKHNDALKDEVSRCRKGLFARQNELAKLFLALHKEMQGEKMDEEKLLNFFNEK